MAGMPGKGGAKGRSGPKAKLTDPVTLTVRVERETHERARALGSDGLRDLLVKHLPGARG